MGISVVFPRIVWIPLYILLRSRDSFRVALARHSLMWELSLKPTLLTWLQGRTGWAYVFIYPPSSPSRESIGHVWNSGIGSENESVCLDRLFSKSELGIREREMGMILFSFLFYGK